MLDTHTHILWNIDDGSKNQCMSLQMLEIAARSGTNPARHRKSEQAFLGRNKGKNTAAAAAVCRSTDRYYALSRSRSADELGAFAGAGSDWRVLFKRR